MINNIQNSMQEVNQDDSFHIGFSEEILDTIPELSAEDQKRVDALNKELDKIFVAPKENLTDAEIKKENELMDAIDKILEKTKPESLTKAQEDQLDSTFKKIDKLFEDGELTANEEKKLADYEASIEKLLENHEPKELSDADQKAIDKLYESLDKLYGVKQPSEKEINRAEEISAELEEIYMAYIEDPGFESFDELEADTFLISELEDLRIEDFNPSEGDVLTFDENLGFESQEHLEGLISEITQTGEDLVVDFVGDDASITLAGVSLDEISWDNVVF